ncbi:AMP-binding protein [Gordonia sp. CPCC 205333]|uniref:AMP-binding protein n=1 Tax=Gordonia sp. CPCC 205333 TaxID=3140790 RepID=UPI003AF354AD
MFESDVVQTAFAAAVSSRVLRTTPTQIYRIIRALAAGGGTNPASLLRIAAARWPDRAAIIDDAGVLSYQQLLDGAEATSLNMHHRYGIASGTTVAIMCRNGRGFVQAVFGAALVGADIVLLNTDFPPSTLATTLREQKIEVVLGDDEFLSTLAAAAPAVTVISPTQPAPDTLAPLAPSDRDIQLVILTSGTTGTPKGVPRQPGPSQVLGVAATILRRTKLRVGDRVVIAVPFFHAFGLGSLFFSVALGATMVTRRRFDAETTLALSSLQRTHALMAVPIMLSRILDLPDEVHLRNPTPTMRVIMSGGAPLDPALATRLLSTYGPVLFNGYGSSEVGIGAVATPADLARSPGTVGKPVAGSPLRVLDEHDRIVPPNVTGRIFVGGRLAFDGYSSGDNKAVAQGMTSTGDMGFVDNFGCLHIVGREDDMIVSGGENVYPQAVENALAEHADVLDSAVVGSPDNEFGQRLVAFVVVRKDRKLTEQALRAYLRTAVSRFEQPRDIHFIDEIPRNPSGKALKRQLSQDILSPNAID